MSKFCMFMWVFFCDLSFKVYLNTELKTNISFNFRHHIFRGMVENALQQYFPCLLPNLMKFKSKKIRDNSSLFKS